MKLLFIISFLSIFLIPGISQEFKRGNIFLGQGGGIIQWRDSNGILIKNINTGDVGGNGNGTGLRIHPLTGKLWVTNSNLPPNSLNGIRIINNDGTRGNTIDISPYQNTPTSITFDRQGNAYVGGLWNDGQLVKINPEGTTILDHYSLSTDGYVWGPEWVEIDCNDSIIYYTNLRAKIKRYNVVTHQQLPDFADLTGLTSWLFAMRLLPDSTMLVVSADHVVFRLNRFGSIIQTYTPTNLCGLFGIAGTADGKSFWVGGGANYGPMYKFDISSGAVQTSFTNNQPGINIYGIEVYGDALKNCKKIITGDDCCKAYPNPSEGIFKLQTILTGSVSITIFNGIGQLVYKNSFNVGSGNNEIPLSLVKLSAGVYIIHLFNDHQNCIEKIVIR